MNWYEEWKHLAARIQGIQETGKYVTKALAIKHTDDASIVKKYIVPSLLDLKAALKQFQIEYNGELPQLANEALKTSLEDIEKSWVTETGNKFQQNILLVAPLIDFRAKFEYLIRDTEIEGRNQTERAFEHLRRLIAVDEDTRRKWKEAYEKHETICESLGAVHLLTHKIWAFKVQGGKAITDLVYPEPANKSSITRTASTLVLTEWKLVKGTHNNAEKKAAEAKKQIEEYKSGVLGGIELKSARYIVLVSEEQLTTPEDFENQGITYRHINIPVSPLTPSEIAKKN